MWCVFVAAGASGILRHEMWRDELQAWLVARDSATLGELFANVAYEGHPPLWHLLLFALSRFASDPLAMQLLHLGLASLGVWIVLTFAPFTRLQQTLLVFGYFPFYEYCVKSRGYVIGVVLLFALCAVFPERRRRPRVLALLLVLLSQTSVLGLILAVALGLARILEIAIDRRIAPRDRIRPVGVAAGLLGVAVAAWVLLVFPPADSGYSSSWTLHFDGPRLATVVSRLTQSYLPDLGFTLYRVRTGWDVALAPVLFAGSVLLLLRRPVALTFYVVGTLGLLGFFYTKYVGLYWHHGHLFLLWVACLWIARQLPAGAVLPRRLQRPALLAERASQWILVLLLVVHLGTGLRAHARDWRRPYSAGKQAAAFLRDVGLDGALLVGDEDHIVVSVAGYLDRGTQVYFIAGERLGTFVRWDRKRLDRLQPGRAVLVRAVEIGAARQRDVVLIATYEIPGDLPPFVERLAAFPDAIWPDETFYLYAVHTAP